jgi:hypothetical protein
MLDQIPHSIVLTMLIRDSQLENLNFGDYLFVISYLILKCFLEKDNHVLYSELINITTNIHSVDKLYYTTIYE